MPTPLTVTSKALPDGIDRPRAKAPRPDTAKKSDPDSGEATMYKLCMYVCMYVRLYEGLENLNMVSVYLFETICIYYYTAIAAYMFECIYVCMICMYVLYVCIHLRILLPSSGIMKGSTWSMLLSSYESPWSTLNIFRLGHPMVDNRGLPRSTKARATQKCWPLMNPFVPSTGSRIHTLKCSFNGR